MKIDLNKEIMALDDKPFLTGEVKQVPKLDDNGEPVLDDAGKPVLVPEQVKATMRWCLILAYANIVQKQGVNLTEKVARGAMAMKIHGAKDSIEFKAEDIVKAKELLNEVIQSPIMLARIMEVLEPSLSAVPEA
jgi:hypothetical protein